MGFCHLHVHDQYSQLDGYGKAEQYAEEAKRLGFTHLGLTNHGNVDGLIKFQKACKEQDIIPVLGSELYIVPDLSVKEKSEKRYHITVLIRSDTGLKNIFKMLTVANLDGFCQKRGGNGQARVDPDLLLRHSEGLIFMSACTSSVVKMPGGVDLLEKLNSKHPGHVFLEVMPLDFQEQKDLNKLKMGLSMEYGWPLVATNDCHYPLERHAKTQEVLLAMQRSAKWNDPKRWKFSVTDLYLKSFQQMRQSFERQGTLPVKTYARALTNTMMVAEMCNSYYIKSVPVVLPKVPGYEDRDETDLFREIVEKGFSSRIKRSRLIHRSEWSKYRERLEEEFGLICELGFQRYFLIVWELINWCKSNGIMVGPGRGSVGGSLIAYLMHITDVDPMKYNLVFARFISPARIDLPDIDMDFEDVKRDRVRKHLEECYGSYNVAGLSTFATLKGRGAIRDVARVFDISVVDTDKAAKSIVVRSGGDFRSSFTIEDACATFEDAIAYKKKYPEVVQLAMDLEGQVKGSGQHAAAMCVSSDDLRAGERCHLAVRKGKVVTNWDKHDAEYMGVMKLDVLGLTALSILSHTKRLVKDNYGVEIDFDKIPLDDSEVFKEISEGHNIGAFQIGSLGLMKLCKEMGISEFNDIVLASALFRPGTLRSGMVTEFVLRKTGVNKITHAHPLLEPITRETLGIILYQEQVMWFMYNLGGLPWKTCDTVRKVISKSQGEEQFQKFKELFIAGCKERGTLKEDEAGSVWDQLSSFGAYGFNKAHAVEYSLITYWDMWCVDGSSKIWDVDRQEFVSVSKAYKIGTSRTVSYNEKTGRTEVNRISRIIKTVHRPNSRVMLQIVTKSGKHLRCTKEHKILTENGFVRALSLKVGDKIAVEKRTNFWATASEEDKKICREKLSVSVKKAHSELGSRMQDGLRAKYYGTDRHRQTAKDTWNKYTDEHRHRIVSNFIESGAKSDNGFCKRFVGTAYDGHKVYSKGELLVDNWLYSRGIPHETQVRIGNKYSDFKAMGVFIEFDGIGRDESYFEDKFGDRPLIVIKKLRDIEHSLSELLEGKNSEMGAEIIYETIISMSVWRNRDIVYDIEMEGEPRNFLANGVVVHNCKVHYPKEFLCASLTHTDDKNKPELVDEARRLGLVLELPKVGSSKATDWVPSKDPSDNRIYMPFREIRGIGEVFAKQLEESDTRPSDHRKEIRPGFFVPKASARKPNAKVIDLLDRIGAFEPDRIYTEEELQEMNQYFSFSLSRDKMGQYSKLCKLMQDSGTVSNISDIDYQYPTNKCSYYFGQMTEIKFGYRKAVEKGAGLARIAGAGGGKDFFESLGGVYGNLKDETDYAMLVFETRTYRAKKFGIEHCAGEWLLTHANHPGRNANLFAMKVWIGQELLDCELDGFDGQLIKEAGPYRQADASHCSKCALREECRRPVNPSPGKYNIAIVAEAPGKDEDRKGMGFVGRAGSDILWPELRKHGLTRNMFHVTNVVKCWPSVTRTPKAKHISECSPWLEEELAALKPVMILAFGNTSVKFFKDREGGIMELCEHTPTEWSNKYGCWINWCVHPASVLYSESNKSLFEKGISNFARKLKYIGGESMGKN